MSNFNSVPPIITALETDIQKLGEAVVSDAVVIGNAAVALAIGQDAWRNHDIDLSVTESAYRYLRTQPGWTEEQQPDGSFRSTNGYYAVGTGWNTTTHDDLESRAWRTENGVQVAGLPDIYAQKQERSTAHDEVDTSLIRTRLQDPNQTPLPLHVMRDIEKIVRQSLPEHLQDDPVAIRLITENVLTDCTLYGDPRIGRTNQIIGDLELPEYCVPATYHNGFGLVQEIRNMGQRFAALERADQTADRTPTFTREDQYDELRSANRLWSRATQLGLSHSRATRLHTAVDMTGFNEKTGKQKGQHHPDPTVREVPGTDLRVLSEPEAIEELVDGLALEDGFSARFSPTRVLGKVAAEHGVRICSQEDGIAFVDAYRDYRPTDAPEGPTVMETWAGRIMGNTGFSDPDSARGYQAPDGYPSNPEMRRLHAAKSRELGARLLAGILDASGASEEAKAHTNEMRERFEIE